MQNDMQNEKDMKISDGAVAIAPFYLYMEMPGFF